MAVLRLVYVATAFLQDNLAESLMLFTWYYKEKKHIMELCPFSYYRHVYTMHRESNLSQNDI